MRRHRYEKFSSVSFIFFFLERGKEKRGRIVKEKDRSVFLPIFPSVELSGWAPSTTGKYRELLKSDVTVLDRNETHSWKVIKRCEAFVCRPVFLWRNFGRLRE